MYLLFMKTIFGVYLDLSKKKIFGYVSFNKDLYRTRFYSLPVMHHNHIIIDDPSNIHISKN